MSKQTETPLVLIAFNRPDLLRQQLDMVRESFNGPIYAIIDGARADRVGEAERVAQVIALVKGLDKDYEIYVNRSSHNLGCYRRIKSGLDWVFSRVDRAIILEDDCMPSPRFFSFAAEMLERFAEDKRIFSISGTNLFPRLSSPGQTYFFSRYHNCWGWATWARAWKHFIDEEVEWREIRNSRAFRKTFRNLRSFVYWRRIFDLTYDLRINSWFYRWILSCWMKEGLSLVPEQNLITNLGDGECASNTAYSPFLRRETGSIPTAIKHPPTTSHLVNDQYDNALEDKMYSKSIIVRLKWIVNRFARQQK